jgi:hypothetical protein
MAALFDQAEGYLERRFDKFKRDPQEGSIRVDGDRYVLVRAEAFYVGLLDGMVARFGERTAFELVYTMAWDIARTDSTTLGARMGADDPLAKIALGPPFFVLCGWGGVTLLDDSRPSKDEDCFLHYEHPYTFESEALLKRGDVEIEGDGGCVFSAGYSAGWVSQALEIELHSTELRCRGLGAEICEFIMCPRHRIEDHSARIRAGWK